MSETQENKDLVRAFHVEWEHAGDDDRALEVLSSYTANNYLWRGMHPFDEQSGAASVYENFWGPLRAAFSHLQRREDIFFAGVNDCDNRDGDNRQTNWVLSAGNFLGLFDHPWLGIPPTGRMLLLPYAEFHRVRNGEIVETALFIDILSVMYQAGVYPLPPMTGSPLVYKLPPRTNDGVLLGEHDVRQGEDTLALVNRMITDLDQLNQSQDDTCPPELLAQTWDKHMIWYGPTGIGASYTIPRYQKQHQLPFRRGLSHKVFNGHVARFAEGNYCGFFGWPNLNNRNRGGFLGLPASDVDAPMRVVDIYRREGNLLVENWVFIDIPHYLHAQGLDVLGRMANVQRPFGR
ncbi:MAG: nuclear transport factor 2 family protein [Spirochaetota bacterium]